MWCRLAAKLSLSEKLAEDSIESLELAARIAGFTGLPRSQISQTSGILFPIHVPSSLLFCELIGVFIL
jgi:hypothetical protein